LNAQFAENNYSGVECDLLLNERIAFYPPFG